VVGTATPRFRLFGDTINTTARMSVRAQWGETVVSHAFAEAIGLPPRETAWGAGDMAEIERHHVGVRLICDGEVPIKGKGLYRVWRTESSELLAQDVVVANMESDHDTDMLFNAIIQKQADLEDEGSALACRMIVVASEYERVLETVPDEPSRRTMLFDMLVRGSDFEDMFLRFKAPLVLPAQFVHSVLEFITMFGMFAVDLTELLAARARGEDVRLLIGVGFACNLSCLASLALLTMLYRKQTRLGAEPLTTLQASIQDACAVTGWLTMIVFLELVHAFGQGANVPSWAFVIAGFLRAHTLYNLLSQGIAVHPQPLGFLVGCLCLLAARALSHIMWEQRAANDQLVTMTSAQCGRTVEWKPRGLVQVLVILIITIYAYINRQLMERVAVHKLVATVRLRRRVLEITTSLLPPHVIPKLEKRAVRVSPGGLRGLFSFAEKHQSVIILHADVVGFTSKCGRVSAGEVFERISILFNTLDDLCREFQLTKIETIGDAYWCSHGLDASATPSDARRMLRFANAMRRVVRGVTLGGEALGVRIGIHVGPMLGGIVGNRLPRYHLFGPHAKLAAVLEQFGAPDAALVSDTFRRLILQPEDAHEADGPGRVMSVGSDCLSDASTAPYVSLSQMNSSFLGSLSSAKWSSAKSASWNVKKWRGFPQTPQSFLSSDEIPDEIGPVVLEHDENDAPVEAVRLVRRQVDEAALRDLDPAVYSALNPCWFVHKLSGKLIRNRSVEHTFSRSVEAERGEAEFCRKDLSWSRVQGVF
jgi:class 3 adenylate cyclase